MSVNEIHSMSMTRCSFLKCPTISHLASFEDLNPFLSGFLSVFICFFSEIFLLLFFFQNPNHQDKDHYPFFSFLYRFLFIRSFYSSQEFFRIYFFNLNVLSFASLVPGSQEFLIIIFYIIIYTSWFLNHF